VDDVLAPGDRFCLRTEFILIRRINAHFAAVEHIGARWKQNLPIVHLGDDLIGNEYFKPVHDIHQLHQGFFVDDYIPGKNGTRKRADFVEIFLGVHGIVKSLDPVHPIQGLDDQAGFRRNVQQSAAAVHGIIHEYLGRDRLALLLHDEGDIHDAVVAYRLVERIAPELEGHEDDRSRYQDHYEQ